MSQNLFDFWFWFPPKRTVLQILKIFPKNFHAGSDGNQCIRWRTLFTSPKGLHKFQSGPPRRHESLLPSSPRSVSVSCGSLVFSSRQSCNPLPISDVTILLSLTVFLNTVSESMPATSDAVPLISKEGEEQEINKLRLGWHSARFCKWSFTQAHVNSAWLSQMSNNLRHTHVVSTCLRIKLFDQLRELNPAPGYEVYPDGPFSIWHLHHWVF